MRKMKKILLLSIIFCWAVVWPAASQNRSITFEPKDWKKAVAKAKMENKLIFLDCHTSWCGPCKNLATNIFTQDQVADFYNKYFVNLAMDMEKDVDGVVLSKIYKPEAYPTLLFIDPQTELVVLRVTGGGNVQRILSIAKEALNSDNTLVGSCNRYRRGERSPEFVKKLMNDLSLAEMEEFHREVAETYFAGLNRKQGTEKENWELFKKHIDNPYSDIFRKVVNARKEYSTLFGEEEVAVALQWVVILELGRIADATMFPDPKEKTTRYRKLVQLLRGMDFRGATALLTDACFALALMSDCRDAWHILEKGGRYKLGDECYKIPDATLLYPLSPLISSLEEHIILTELLDWVDRIKLRCSSMPYLARLALNRSLILARLGELKEASAARTEYEQYCTMR